MGYDNAEAIIGIRRGGTSWLWDVLAHDPVYRRRYFEPIGVWDWIRNPAVQQQSWHTDLAALYHAHPELFGETRTEQAYLNAIFAQGALVKQVELHWRVGWELDMFPHLRALLLLRDPRAVTCSMLMHPADLTGTEDTDFTVQLWEVTRKQGPDDVRAALDTLTDEPPVVRSLACIARIYAQLLSVRDARALVIRHEDVMRRPVTTLRAIYRHWGRAVPCAVMSRLHSWSVRHPGAWFGRPLDSGRARRYLRHDRDTWARLIARAGVGDIMHKIGYPP